MKIKEYIENTAVELIKILINTLFKMFEVLGCGSNAKKIIGMTIIDKLVSSFLRATEWSLLYNTETTYTRNKEELMSSHFQLITRLLKKKSAPANNKITGSPFNVFGIIGKIAKIKISLFKMFSLLIFLMI